MAYGRPTERRRLCKVNGGLAKSISLIQTLIAQKSLLVRKVTGPKKSINYILGD